MDDAATRMICCRCGRETAVDLAACLTGRALWPRCCDRGLVFATFPTAQQIEAVMGALLVSAATAVLVARERESRADA